MAGRVSFVDDESPADWWTFTEFVLNFAEKDASELDPGESGRFGRLDRSFRRTDVGHGGHGLQLAVRWTLVPRLCPLHVHHRWTFTHTHTHTQTHTHSSQIKGSTSTCRKAQESALPSSPTHKFIWSAVTINNSNAAHVQSSNLHFQCCCIFSAVAVRKLEKFKKKLIYWLNKQMMSINDVQWP